MAPPFSASFAAALTATAVVSGFALLKLTYELYQIQTKHKKRKSRDDVLQSLPPDLDTWRCPGRSIQAEEKVWQDLDEVLREAGYTQWSHKDHSMLTTPGLAYPSQGGYAYFLSSLGDTREKRGSAHFLRCWSYTNPSNRAVMTKDGRAYIMRVVVIKEEGREHLRILRKLGTGMQSLASSNHTLPMVQEFQFGHVTFGVFPWVARRMAEAYGGWAKNSVGDVLDMVLQALEGLAYIHNQGIAHRDAFEDNFLVEWHPESLLTGKIPVTRPRVHLIDFEVAVSFEQDCPPSQRMSSRRLLFSKGNVLAATNTGDGQRHAVGPVQAGCVAVGDESFGF
ncbi:hypothetical protein AX16_006943 [Volvariella volvacea WC 439]|nr:hypothetical protein AX16_006943 [Volvariella volvacea WC 439]